MKALAAVPVAAVATGVADTSNPNVVILPPRNAALVVPPEPNVNGFADAVAVGAVVLKPPPNANGVALVVVGFVDNPKQNIFLKYSI
jgi:hypothetical protein